MGAELLEALLGFYIYQLGRPCERKPWRDYLESKYTTVDVLSERQLCTDCPKRWGGSRHQWDGRVSVSPGRVTWNLNILAWTLVGA